MRSEWTGAGRRTLLQRGMALVAGGLAVAAGTRSIKAATRAPSAETMRLYARTRPFTSARASASGQAADRRLVSSGELRDAPDGHAIGAFHTSCFCLDTPFGPHTHADSNLEFHVLQLTDGTLFGIGGAADQAHALVGGTGRYAGARGSYIARTPETPAAGSDVVELIITLAS